MTQVKIGLETHVQLDTETKLFCSCKNQEAEEPNTYVCETCLGHPGSKPRLNEKVKEHAVQVSQALKCRINQEMNFSRKTYFYPDMSKNYQITQYELPVSQDGEIDIEVESEEKTIGIKRVHIEEDPAKLKHQGGSIQNANYTLVDYNRAGTPLLEIVTKPHFKSPKEAREYLQQLERILEYLGIYESDSKFTIKSDANISIDGGERVEVKNITGTKGIQKALSYEITRQKQLKKRGREITQETRSYNAGQEITEELREKETEEDYGYIFDPDLTHQQITENYRETIKENIPELPHQKAERFKEEYQLEEQIIKSLISEKQVAILFEELIKQEEHDPETTASYLTKELKKVLNYHDLKYSESQLEKQKLSEIISLIEEDSITDRNAEILLRKQVEEPEKEIETIVEEENLLKAEDSIVDDAVEKVLNKNQDAVEDFRKGKEDALNFLVGQVMQQTQGKADPKETREKLKQKLEE